MELHHWAGIAIAIVTTVIGAFWAWHKWSVTRDDQIRFNINNAQDRTLEAHQARLDRHREQINRLDDLVQATRDEMSRNYVRLEHIEKLEGQIRDLEKSIDGKLDKIHIRVGSLARDVNQTIGNLKGNHDSEISKLVEQIKLALESSVRPKT